MSTFETKRKDDFPQCISIWLKVCICLLLIESLFYLQGRKKIELVIDTQNGMSKHCVMSKFKTGPDYIIKTSSRTTLLMENASLTILKTHIQEFCTSWNPR